MCLKYYGYLGTYNLRTESKPNKFTSRDKKRKYIFILNNCLWKLK